MARKARGFENVQQRFAERGVSAGRRVRRLAGGGELDHTEILSIICRYFCKGYTASQIVATLKKKNLELRREDPYQYIAYAASRGWMRFVAPHEHALQEKIRHRFGWLQNVEVVHTSVFEDVAYHGASMLIGVLQQLAPSHPEVHIGFAGGHAMRKLAWTFAQFLREPIDGLPRAVVFHAMVAGFDVLDPTTDPNAFFTYFHDDPAIQVETRFVGLHAPAVVKAGQFEELKDLDGIRECYACKDEIDVIVTSASSWPDEHGMLRGYTGKSPKSERALKAAGCVGDMLWRPLSRKGPIEIETEIRAMTLMELSELPAFIASGKRVLLALGPCVRCDTPKAEVLEAVLNTKPPLITHLVVDSRSARPCLRHED